MKTHSINRIELVTRPGLLSNDVYGPEDPDSEARGGGRPLSRAINVNVVAKTPLEFRTNVKKKPKKKNLHTRR